MSRKRKRLKIWIAWSIVLSCLLGCVARKASPYPADTTVPDPYSFYKKIQERCQSIRSLKGLADVHIKQEGKTLRVEEIVVLQKPGSLRLETVDFWGQTIFVWIVHRGEWLAFSVPDNLFLKGQSAIDKIREFIGFAWDPEIMVRFLEGDPFYLGIQQPTVHISRDEGYFLLDVEDKNAQIRYLVWVGEGDLPVRSLLVAAPADSQYTEGIQVDYDNYKTINGVVLPFAFVAAGPHQESVLTVEYRSLLLNSSLEDTVFDFQPP